MEYRTTKIEDMDREIEIFNVLMWKERIILLTINEDENFNYEEIMRRADHKLRIDTTREIRKNQAVRGMRGEERGEEVRPYR